MSMTREESIRFLERYVGNLYYTPQCQAAHRMAIEALKEQAERRWIPVTERLPEREGRYLCVKRIGKSGSGYVQIMNGDSYGFSMEHIYTDDVTHWMPLPEGPKEEIK